MKASRNNAALDRIDMELNEIAALVACLRRLWEEVSPGDLDEAREIGVAVAFVVADKIDAARRVLPAAYVFRVKAGRG